MKKRFNTRQFFLGPRAKAVVDAITSTTFHLVLVVVLLVIGIVVFKLSTEQFSPEVHKITIENLSNTKRFVTIDVQAALNSSIIKSKFGVNQFLTITYSDTNKKQEPDAFLNNFNKTNTDGVVYKQHSRFKATFSGRDVFNPDYPDTLWHYEEGLEGISKSRGRMVAPSTFEIDQISVDGRRSGMGLGFHGNDIFFNSKSRNPYIAFYLKINGMGLEEDMMFGGISLYYDVNNEKDSREKDNSNYQHPINIISSYPPPSTISPIGITYDKDIFREILQNGLYLIAEDLSVKKDRERESFFYSMLLGAIITWIIQLVVSMVRKWKAAFENVPPKTNARKRKQTKKEISLNDKIK